MARRRKSRQSEKRRAKREQIAEKAEAERQRVRTVLGDACGTKGSRMEWDLSITLRSDLCMATGDGFSSGIDVDVCLDGSGLPYIPARRLKGCMRSAAELIVGEDEQALCVVQDLFGRRGEDKPGSIVVTDATIRRLGNKDASAAIEGMSREEVIDLLTYVRAQTALVPGKGYAKENTLRFVRVSKQHDPFSIGEGNEADSATPLVFVAKVVADVQYEEVLANVAHALRNIGFGRNRGFGAVSCKLENRRVASRNVGRQRAGHIEGQGGSLRIAYKVRLDAPLMLPQEKGGQSLDYVPGTNVLGFFASMLAESRPDVFDGLILSGKLRFSPLYPVGDDGLRCVPASPFVLKVKGGVLDGGLYTNRRWAELEKNALDATPKPLGSGFVDVDWLPVDVRTEVIYHHSTGKTSGSEQATLYTQRCLSAGQELAGYLEADDLDTIRMAANVLESCFATGLSFGRSKTAQYARCTLMEAKYEGQRTDVAIRKGKAYAFLLDSDVLLADGSAGRLSVDFEVLKDEVRKALGDESHVFGRADVEAGRSWPGTSLSYRTVTGYNAKWRQKRPHVRAIVAGSAIEFVADADGTVPGELFIGMRKSEGFGRVLVVPIDDIACPIVGKTLDVKTSSSRGMRRIESLREHSIDYAEQRRDEGFFSTPRLNPSFVGRLSRMVSESESPAEIGERIGSISRRKKQEDARELIDGLVMHLRANGYPSLTWGEEKECLLLVLTLGKYYTKQANVDADSNGEDGGHDE